MSYMYLHWRWRTAELISLLFLIGKKLQLVNFVFRGSFKNYVDKVRWVGGQKMPILCTFLHTTVGRWSEEVLKMQCKEA